MSARLSAMRRAQSIAIRAERIDPARLVDGRPLAATSKMERTVRKGTHRHYAMTVGGIDASAQLNHGDKADDPMRLRDIAENLLVADPLPDNLETQPTPGPYWYWTSDKGLIRGVRR